MSAAEILACPIALTRDPEVAPQPSVREIVKAHYARQFGNAGNALANAYLENLSAALDVRVIADAAHRSAATPAVPDEAGDIPAASDKADLEVAMEERQAVAKAMLDFLSRNSQHLWFSTKELESLLKAWQASAVFRDKYPILGRSDVNGGFAEHYESPTHIGAVLRSLSRSGVVGRDGTRFCLTADLDKGPKPQGASKQSASGTENTDQTAALNPFSFLESLFPGRKTSDRSKAASDDKLDTELFPESFLSDLLTAAVLATIPGRR